MTLHRLIMLLPVLGLTMSVACFDDKDEDEDEDEDDSGSEGGGSWGGTTSSTAPTSTTSDIPSVSVTWGSSAIEIDVLPRDDYWFGLTEVGFDEAWTGEDCVYGYSYEGTTLAYCHEVQDGEAQLTYSGDPMNLSAGTTVFPDSSYETGLSYFLETSGGACFVWGADPSYYDGLGCDQL